MSDIPLPDWAKGTISILDRRVPQFLRADLFHAISKYPADWVWLLRRVKLEPGSGLDRYDFEAGHAAEETAPKLAFLTEWEVFLLQGAVTEENGGERFVQAEKDLETLRFRDPMYRGRH